MTARPERIAEHFGLGETPDLAPRFNIAPGQPVATIFVPTTAAGGSRALASRRWGLIPPWAGDARIGNRQINARVETVAEKPAFRAAFRQRRCLVAADGFYEWSGAARAKQPYFIGLGDREIFGFAGLWESWRGPEGRPIETCTVLTTAANERVGELHPRMPVILDPAHYARWLDPELQDPARLHALIDRAESPAGALSFFPVSHRVNDVHRDDPECLARVELQPTLF